MSTWRASSHGPVNLGNLAWGVGQLSGTRQCWVLDRAGVSNTAKQNAGVHPCMAQPTLHLAILSAPARRRLVPLTQSWQNLARCVLHAVHRLRQNTPSNAKREKASCATWRFARLSQGGRWHMAVEGPYTPVPLRCQEALSLPPSASPSLRPMATFRPIPWQQNGTAAYGPSRATWAGGVPRSE